MLQGLASSFRNPIRAILGSAILGTCAFDRPAKADTIPEREAIVQKKAEESWAKLKTMYAPGAKPEAKADAHILWNDLITTLMLSDETKFSGMDDLRAKLLIESTKNPEIPGRVAQVLLYSTARLSKALTDEKQLLFEQQQKLVERKSELDSIAICKREAGDDVEMEVCESSWLGSEIEYLQKKTDKLAIRLTRFKELSLPWIGKVPVDLINAGTAERILVTPDKTGKPSDSDITSWEAYTTDSFHRLGGFLFANSADEKSILELGKRWIALPDSDPQKAIYLDTLLMVDGKLIPQSVKEYALERLTKEKGKTELIELLGNAKDQRLIPILIEAFKGLKFDSVLSDKEVIAVRFLAEAAKDDPAIFEEVKKIGNSFPGFVFIHVTLNGARQAGFNNNYLAGTSILELFKSKPQEMETWIRDLHAGKGDLIFTDHEHSRKAKEAGKTVALLIMALENAEGKYSDVLRTILDDSFSSSAHLYSAINGVSLARDEASITQLLKISQNTSRTKEERQAALAAVLAIDTPIPLALNSNALKLSGVPFLIPTANYYYGHKDAALNFDSSFALIRIQKNFTQWNSEDVKLRPAALSQDFGAIHSEKYIERQTKAYIDQELGGGREKLKELAKTREFQEQFLKPILESYQSASKNRVPVDISMHALNLRLLALCEYSEARNLFLDLVVRPEVYVTKNYTANLIDNNALNINQTRSIALEGLGRTAELSEKGLLEIAVLHRIVQRDGLASQRDAALHGLMLYAKRLDGIRGHKIVKETLAKDLLKSVEVHIEKARLGEREKLDAHEVIFDLARVAANSGDSGKSSLIRLILREETSEGVDGEMIREIPPRSFVTKAVVQALLTTGVNAKNVKKFKLEAENLEHIQGIFKYVENEEYGAGHPALRNFKGKGSEYIVLDVGWVVPNSLTKWNDALVLYPPKTLSKSRVGFGEDTHPTMVYTGIATRIPDANAWSIPVNGIPQRDFLLPSFLSDADFRGLEEITKMILEGKANPIAMNSSFSMQNRLLHNPKFAREYFDLIGAYYERLNDLGLIHSVSAGNSHGSDAKIVRYPGLGEQNPMGARVTSTGQVLSRPGLFRVGASDLFAHRPATFTSAFDAVVENYLNVLGCEGVNRLLGYLSGSQMVWRPGSGTSFANNELISLWVKSHEYLIVQNVKGFKFDDFETLLMKSYDVVPDHEKAKMVGHLNVGKYWENLKGFAEARKASSSK